MFWRMLRDDRNRMANVRRAHKVKVKRHEDKVWKVSNYAPVRPAVGKQNIEKTKGTNRGKENGRKSKWRNGCMCGSRYEKYFARESARESQRGLSAVLRGSSNNVEEDYGMRWSNEIKSEMGSSTWWLSIMSNRYYRGYWCNLKRTFEKSPTRR